MHVELDPLERNRWELPLKTFRLYNRIMANSLFLQNVIALIWDFDNTLIPGNMQELLFQHYGVDPEEFWREVNQLPNFYRHRGVIVSPDTLYLNQILTYVQEGVFGDLNNQKLESLGAKLSFFEGQPHFFSTIKKAVENDQDFSKHEISVEHYIVSTGLRRMIKGSAIGNLVDDIWGCEFIEAPASRGYLSGVQSTFTKEVISQIGYVIDNTSKTRAIFEINKGSNKFDIDVNATVPQDKRRVPFQNMIYVADGPSDIPSFSIINQYGGKTFAVYKPGSRKHFEQVYDLQAQGRVQGIGEANYQEDSQTYLWLVHTVVQMARQIVKDRAQVLADVVKPPPHHIVEQPLPSPLQKRQE